MLAIDIDDIELKERGIIKESLKSTMIKEGFSEAMVKLVIKDLNNGDMRYYIGDTSGSMNSTDGKIYLNGDFVSSTRFDEMRQSLKRSYNICSRSNIRSQFYSFLSDTPVEFDKLTDLDTYKSDQLFNKLFYTAQGPTPLFSKLNLVLKSLKTLDNNNGMKRKLIIFSDGRPSDCNVKEIVDILNEIVKFNTSITIRLCTGESEVISYWDTIDKCIEFDLDIIDDYKNEKKSVKRLNRHLKYKYPLHMLREFGIFKAKFDRIDEGKLSDLDIDSINELYDIEVNGCC